MTPASALHILQSARSIGILRTDRLGDMVCTLPLASIIKQQFSSAEIHLITRSYCLPLLHHTPAVHHVHCVDRTPLASILRSTKFDALFFPRPVAEEAWAAARAGIPLRVGSAYRWYSPLFTFRARDHRKESRYHEVEYNTRMLGAITAKDYTPQLVPPVVDPRALEAAEHLLDGRGVSAEHRVVVLHPGSGGSAREWPAQSFGQLAAALTRLPNVRVVITGITAEADACARVAAGAPAALNLCGECPLDVMIALCRRASLLVANSTGVLHIAAASGTPVVGLFPATDSMSQKRWGPYSASARVVSSAHFAPAHDADNLQYIPVDAVIAQCLSALEAQ